LAADSETVLDVPAKLAARVRVYSRGHGRKTDKDVIRHSRSAWPVSAFAARWCCRTRAEGTTSGWGGWSTA
jgi:hypothetical protein